MDVLAYPEIEGEAKWLIPHELPFSGSYAGSGAVGTPGAGRGFI